VTTVLITLPSQETIKPKHKTQNTKHKKIGFKALFSASDVVYAVSALLEATYFSTDPLDNPQKQASENEGEKKSLRDDIWVTNFFRALDSLEPYKSFF